MKVSSIPYPFSLHPMAPETPKMVPARDMMSMTLDGVELNRVYHNAIACPLF